jgi:hypothetical protein
MNAKLWSALAMALLPLVAAAQESARKLDAPGKHGAFLTPGQVDRWEFDGAKGETIIAHVVSREFDPLLGLSQTEGRLQDKILFDYDDPGNESRFMVRLPENGQFKIRVSAFKNQAGGNYTLNVRRFQAEPLTVGKSVLGNFDHEGKAYHIFQSTKDQVLVPQVKGTAADAWTVLDTKGRDMVPWAGSVHVDVAGEGCIVLSGRPEQRYDLLLREARQQDLGIGKERTGKLRQGEMAVLSLAGKVGDFRVIEVEKKGDMQARLMYAPEEQQPRAKLGRNGSAIEFLPVASRGGRLRYAAVLGRAGRYQLQIRAETDLSYKLSATDPSVPIAAGKDLQGRLPVGGAAFYRFEGTPGQLFHANLASTQFVPQLRLYDARGQLVAQSGSDNDTLDGRIAHMVVKAGRYRLQVSSEGDGGGGAFRLSLAEIQLKDIAIGGRGKGTVQPGDRDFWAFTGKRGQTVFLNVRSGDFDPAVSVRSPDGVQLAADTKGDPATGTLLALRLPKTGRYTVWIASQRGAGDYAVRLIDGD